MQALFSRRNNNHDRAPCRQPHRKRDGPEGTGGVGPGHRLRL
jgi:hypothetical protein